MTTTWNMTKKSMRVMRTRFRRKVPKKHNRQRKRERKPRTRSRDKQGQIKQLSARLEDLLHKNEALVVELGELEKMASEAGDNKDMIIRKLEETEFR